MVIGRVIGTVVASVKVEGYQKKKLMLVQLLTEDLEPRGAPQVALDAVGDAGRGDLVFLATKKEAAQPFEGLAPVDLAIAGFVDKLTIEG